MENVGWNSLSNIEYLILITMYLHYNNENYFNIRRDTNREHVERIWLSSFSQEGNILVTENNLFIRNQAFTLAVYCAVCMECSLSALFKYVRREI